MLNLTNQLFRIYFRINKLNLLKPLIRAIEADAELYEKFSMADKVTYNYYLGRKAMFDSDLALWDKKILFRLLPIHANKLTEGIFRDGNLKKLDEAFSQHEHFFVDCGIFLMLEKLKIITFRNLFKKVANIVASNQIPLESFMHALHWLGIDDI
uniref:CSN12-like protein n=1 Tax=Parascaris equorum TaxID=6256 RepID=A0A914RIV3_PAREQ